MKLRAWLWRMLCFAGQETLSCLFPGLLFLTFGVSKLLARVLPPELHRYDLILLACLGIQYALYRLKFETRDEIKVIAVFHLLGLALELYKTHLGCWSYPEAGWTKVAGVPLYSGFMYASVASYLCQAWRRLQVTVTDWPAAHLTLPLVTAIYLNFFTEHVLPDARWVLGILVVALFRRTRVEYGVADRRLRMPITAAFVLIGVFVWVAENIATRLGAWQYPDQHAGWHPVHWEKISSWSLLVILSFIIVAQLKHFKGNTAPSRDELTSELPWMTRRIPASGG